MNRPDVDKILSPLKSFQRRTVDHAFDRLFLAPDSTARFLVADEVGLGKTLVARGIIAKAIDHLWDDVQRIDIIYVCSNGSIARANLPKLRVGDGGAHSFALTTRLTMLASEFAPKDNRPGLGEAKLNFVSFTPRTSFDLGNASGQASERELLFALLAPGLGGGIPLMNLLQGNVTKTEGWRARLKWPPGIDDGVRDTFARKFAERSDLRDEITRLCETWFKRERKEWPAEAQWQRNKLIGQLRQLLAGVCIDALQPDLVILDEFQRFKQLLNPDPAKSDLAAELARALFEAKTPEGNPVRTLLLSATPYKAYTGDAEIGEEDHHAEFVATTRFLFKDDQAKVQELQTRLARYGRMLKRAASGEAAPVVEAKAEVEELLRAVMVRTERVAASEERDAMVEETRPALALGRADVQQYLAADALFRAVGDRDPMVLWKSAPYLTHFMHGYKFNERLRLTVKDAPAKVAGVLRRHGSAFLDVERLRAWKELELANAKLLDLGRDLLDTGLWRLLWMPPTVPYWPLRGPFMGHEHRTKVLLFSAWNVVPDVVSAVLSFEAERRMAGGRLREYDQPARQQAPGLRLTQDPSGTRSRHRLFLLLLPCLRLVDEAHPLLAPQGRDRTEWVRERVAALLDDLPDPQEGEVDDRWEWAAPLLLDPGLVGFLAAWRDDDRVPRPNPELFKSYVQDFLGLDVKSLGRRPPGLVDLLTEVALGAPGVLAARTMGVVSGLSDTGRRKLAVQVADAFWRLFNRPTVITLLKQDSDGDTESVYWRAVLRYCQDGNLQAILDECWHQAWEQHSWTETDAPEDVAGRCAREIASAVKPKVARVHAAFYSNGADTDSGQLRPDELRIRTAFALRFGDAAGEREPTSPAAGPDGATGDGEDEEVVGQDAVRKAFNSPFRPFLLASTSVGQEGLDFHPWCHRLVHWNLPGNPVDLEQREGRVHRYKCHAVRRNVAASHADEALASWIPGTDLWQRMFELADRNARAEGADDLVPHWIAPGTTRVNRHVPMLPYTREVQEFARLKRRLAAYRVVFGQPRQEEFVDLLDRADLDAATLGRWAIDLTPPRDGEQERRAVEGARTPAVGRGKVKADVVAD